MDPYDNCWNKKCNDHDLYSYHYCIKYQTRDPIKCDNYISRENDHKLQKLLGKEAALAIKKQTDKKLEPLKSVIDKPKTKRVAVIWFGDVTIDADAAYLNITRDRRVIDIEKEVDLIPENEVEIESFEGGNGEDGFISYTVRLDTPQEPETVEQVMDDKPGLPDIKADQRLHIDDYLAWAKRLIEAEEREQLNGKS